MTPQERYQRDRINALKRELRNSAYRYSAVSPVKHAGHAMDINIEGRWMCHTCRKAGF